MAEHLEENRQRLKCTVLKMTEGNRSSGKEGIWVP